jgi:hypothetical protein
LSMQPVAGQRTVAICLEHASAPSILSAAIEILGKAHSVETLTIPRSYLLL